MSEKNKNKINKYIFVNYSNIYFGTNYTLDNWILHKNNGVR